MELDAKETRTSCAEEQKTNADSSILNPGSELRSRGRRGPGDWIIFYDLDDVPHWYILFMYTLQQLAANVGGVVSASYLLGKAVACGQEEQQALTSQILSSTLFMAGISSLLQIWLGTRLPILQMSSFAYVPSVLALMRSPEFSCETQLPRSTSTTEYGQVLGNASMVQGVEPMWINRVREISGGIVIAGVFEMLLGMTGLMGCLTRCIGPLTIAPTLILLALGIVESVAGMAEAQWGVSILVICTLFVFGIILKNFKVLLPSCTAKDGFNMEKFPIFQLFPHLIALTVGWLLCYILTITGTLSNDPTHPSFKARTDTKLSHLSATNWFYIPYPGQYGLPTLGLGSVVGMMASALSSTIESVGDYIATSKVCNLAKPPPHAINRGIMLEGLVGILAGFVGCCHSTTSYSTNLGFIRITKVASRYIWMFTAVVLLLGGVIGKVAVVLTMIPVPVLAGFSFTSLAYVIAVGTHSLRSLSKDSVRNEAIFGVSMMLGLAVPTWARANGHNLATGSTEFDQLVSVLLNSAMLVGGVTGFILDNVIPGTPEERGMRKDTAEEVNDVLLSRSRQAHKLPFLDSQLRKLTISKYLPFLPGFDDDDDDDDGEDDNARTVSSGCFGRKHRAKQEGLDLNHDEV